MRSPQLCHAPLTDLQAFRYNMIGAFFNQTLPSSIGGDAVRLWLVNRTGAGWRAATYSILTDRAIGLIALALMIVASLPWSYGMIADSNGRLALVVVDFAALAGGLGFLLLGHLPWTWLKTWWPTKHIHACSVIANKVIFDRRSGPKIAVLSLSIHVLAVVIAWCAVRSISAPADFEQVFMLIPPIMLITMMPISIAGWGVREATMMVAFGYAGLAQTDGTVVSILFGAVYFIVGGPAAWFGFSARRRQRLQLTSPMQSRPRTKSWRLAPSRRVAPTRRVVAGEQRSRSETTVIVIAMVVTGQKSSSPGLTW